MTTLTQTHYETSHPQLISFGCVSKGYVYQIKFSIVNKEANTQRFRFELVNDCDEDNEYILKNEITVRHESKYYAPGLKAVATIELTANKCEYCQFTLLIYQSNNEFDVMRKSVRALVVKSEIYKELKLGWKLREIPQFIAGVTLIRRLSSDDDLNYEDDNTSLHLRNLIETTDNIEEITEFPMIPSGYWDPRRKTMTADDVLLKV